MYEFFELFTERTLLDDLDVENLLSPLSLTALLVAAILAGIYYFALDKHRYARVSTWAVVGLMSGLLTAFFVIATCYRKADQEVLRNEANPNEGKLFDQGGGVFFGFGLEMLFLNLLLFVLISVFAKRFSTNNRKVPF